MPIFIPPFDQYQTPMFPLRGLWNAKPAEGDRFVNVEIDWLQTTNNRAVQFLLSGNSPVALSQIAALSVDNRRSGYDIDFAFPDSGFTLTVPAYNQGVYPVFTNALMFYAIAAEGVVSGNRTVFQILNSVPPPVALNPTAMQTKEGISGIALADGTTAIVDPSVSGTVNGLSIIFAFGGTGSAEVTLIDGLGDVIWQTDASGIAGSSQVISLTGLDLRFVNGLSLLISNRTGAANLGVASVNIFYNTP